MRTIIISRSIAQPHARLDATNAPLARGRVR
jgi:hypothetical protein